MCFAKSIMMDLNDFLIRINVLQQMNTYINDYFFPILRQTKITLFIHYSTPVFVIVSHVYLRA